MVVEIKLTRKKKDGPYKICHEMLNMNNCVHVSKVESQYELGFRKSYKKKKRNFIIPISMP